MAAPGFSDKLRLLQERDKELRETRERHTDIETARAVKGTCVDMCPEIERYFREETNQVSPLEMSNGKPDYDAMIKEYRRAGADQSEPLPHEMRPGPVLARTMDYLACNILDKLDTNPELISDWYDFLWSRTRAIRKDITQQHLCDMTSVDLLEKCTRFHIHCAATLVEEDSSVFDFKINDENLRKCMQSLKDFYHDLFVKNGQTCPNEEEFRCYDILLNLEDGDILRQIKHLRRQVRDSPTVRFAVSAHFALISNNYVKFFNLVRSTTYLNACLCHRYFNRIRTRAIRLMRKSFTTLKEAELFPSEYFCRLLGFDDLTHVAQFCSMFDVNFDGTYVYLTREKSYFELPQLPPTRSKILVEGKRTVSVGEVVYGSNLPPNPYKKFPLHSSFQADGSLKRNALQHPPSPQIQQNQSSLFKHPLAVPLTTPERQDSKEVILQRQIGIISEDLAHQVIGSVVSSVVAHLITDSRKTVRQESIASVIADQLVEETIQPVLRGVVKSVHWEQSEIQKIKQVRERIISAAQDLSSDLIEQVVRDEIRNVCCQVHSSYMREYTTSASKGISTTMINTISSQLLRNIVKEVIDEFTEKQEELIAQQQGKRRLRLAQKAFYHWLSIYQKNKKLSLLRATFPASCMETAAVQIVHVTKSSSKRTRSRSSGPIRKSPRTNFDVKEDQRIKFPLTNQSFVSSRPRSTDVLNSVRERIALAGSSDPEDQLRFLQMRLKEEAERNESSQRITDCITRSMIHLEQHELQG